MMTTITTTINILDILKESDFELELVPYMLKLHLLESNIPVILDVLSIRSGTPIVSHGILTAIETDFTITYTWNLK